MKKIFEVSDMARKSDGEYVLGSEDLKTHACYLVYGSLAPLEKGRTLRPGAGHEEIVCLVSGEVILRGQAGDFMLKAGQAFHLSGEESYTMENAYPGSSVYVISGGHSAPHKH